MDQPVILCGLGRVGTRVLEYLRAASVPVVVVDLNTVPTDPRLEGVRLVRGDCRQQEVLEQAGLSQAGGVLILTSDDLVNISTTLMVRHLNPQVRVVVRVFNQNLIPRLGKAVNNVFALSVSALTAPLLALTALAGDALGAFALEDGRRQIAEVTISEHSPLVGRTVAEAAAHCRLLVIAHFPANGPDRFLTELDSEARLVPGDVLVSCGEPRDLAGILAQGTDEVLPHVLWAGWLRRQLRVLRRTLAEVDLAVKIATAVLLFVVLASTVVYRFTILSDQKNWADALYMTISVIATGSDMHGDDYQGLQKVFVSCLRIAGAALLAAFTAIFTNYLLRARLGGALEVRRIPDGGHVVVCGLGNVGFRVVEELLRHGERVVVVERVRDSRFMATARRLGVAVVVGDATVQEVLRQAHAATARAVVAATDNELVNVEVALLARELNPKQRVVVRLSDPHLAQTLREASNIRLALSIPSLAAPAFVAALFGDRVQSVFLVGGRMLAVVELLVQPGDSYLNGLAVKALAADYQFLPVAVSGPDHAPRPPLLEHRLSAGDRLTAIAALSDLERLLRRERGATELAATRRPEGGGH